MAQKFNWKVTAKKIVSPDGKIFNYPSGQDTMIVNDAELVMPLGGNTGDSLIITRAGWQITAQVGFNTLATNLSATDSTGS